MADLEIFVFIQGDLPASKNMFSIIAHDDSTVSTWRKLVYTEKQNHLKGYDAADLRLWKLEQAIPLASVDEKMGDLGSIADEMLPANDLSDYFSVPPPRKHLHVIAVLPSLPSAGEKHGLSEDENDGEPASKRRKGPRLSDEPTRLSAQTDPRKHTVKVLYQLLCKERVIQVTGTPGSGKTTLLDLLHQVIRNESPNARVFVVTGWPRKDLQNLDFRDRWPKMVKNWDGYKTDDFYLIDEGHTSYWDETLWKAFKDDFQRTNITDAPCAVLFCSYSEDLREIHSFTPPSLEAAKLTLARVTRPPNGAEDMTPVGLLLDWDEYLGVLSRFTDKMLLLDDELKKFIFEFTAGHVGAVKAMFDYMIKTEEAVMTEGRTVTFTEFQRKDLTFQNLTQYLTMSPTVSRSLTKRRDYDGTMKRLLLEGPISRHDKDEGLFANASKYGLIELTDCSFYDFPSPLHRQIWSYKLMPSGQYKYPGDILALIQDTVAKFRPNQLSRSDRRAETDERDPPQAQYSHEWYRSLHGVTGGNVVISPEYATAPGKRRGRVDFYIPSMKWGIELLRDGSKLREHSDRFLIGAYSALVKSGDIVDYALLDFRHTLPLAATPEIPNIFYIVFSEENDRAWIYDKNLDCKWQDNLAHNGRSCIKHSEAPTLRSDHFLYSSL